MEKEQIKLNEREHQLITLLSRFNSFEEATAIITEYMGKSITCEYLRTDVIVNIKRKLGTNKLKDTIRRAIELNLTNYDFTTK